MKITTVLFGLDGTLLPMDQDVFIKDYLSRLAQKMKRLSGQLAMHTWDVKPVRIRKFTRPFTKTSLTR